MRLCFTHQMPVSEIVLVVMGLLAVAMLAASFTRNSPIPYTVFLVVVGVLLSTAANHVPALSSLQDFHLTPDLVFFVFLPALIFESALNLDARRLLKDIAPIFVLAAPALIISTVIIGIGIWWYVDIELILALLFGALIAATDPVAVVALFKELGAPARLTTLVEGESLFNDATAIVLFNILLGIALAGDFTAGDVTSAVGRFFLVFFGGVITGAAIGFGLAEIMRRIRGSNLAIIVMSLVMAYSSFVIAEHLLHVSGVMAAVSAAVAMGAYAVSRIPHETLRSVHETWEVIALVCNSLLFLMIGLSVNIGLLIDSLDSIFIAALLVLAARAASVYTLVPATIRLFSLPEVNLGERHIMWWGGLKGGLAIAIVLSVPETLAGRETLVELTLGVVLFTLLINAPSIRPLIQRLGIDRMSEEEIAELHRGLTDAQRDSGAVVQRLADANLLNLDRQHEIGESVRRIFQKEAQTADARRTLRHAYVEAINLEADELQDLYGLGIVREYTFLDLRAELHRELESWTSPGAAKEKLDDQARDNPFHRLESAILSWIRERNAFAGALARFQRARLSQGVQRDIAGILCGESVISKLPTRDNLESQDMQTVISHYSEKVARKRRLLATIRLDFPEFFDSLENRLVHIAALTNARNHAQHSFHHGDIGAKVFGRIEQVLDSAKDRIAPIKNPDRQFSAAELIERVPLFGGLPDNVIEKLVARTRTVTFLTGDVVIGQHQKGNALYILVQGSVEVSQKKDGVQSNIAELGPGNFFGETALLGDDVRTATVIAMGQLTLLRLTRKSVLDLADLHPEISRRLKAAGEARAN